MTALITSVADPEELGGILAARRGNEGFVYIAAGFHPHEVPDHQQDYIDRYIETLRGLRYDIVAIGEVGLEYRGFYEPRHQQEVFSQFVDLAIEMDRPLVIHCREAWPDTVKILLEKKAPHVVFHCYSGSEGITKVILGQPEWYISFATNLCFTKKHPRLAELVPLNRMMLETDSPWLDPGTPPGTKQEMTNRPWKLLETAKRIAQIKGVSVEEVLKVTTENAKRVFALG
jgi:TatD DNase family protein